MQFKDRHRQDIASSEEPDNLLDIHLSQDELQEINSECMHYPERRAAAIEALKIVQHYRGWVSDPVLFAVARELGMPAGELEGVATFYNLIYRKPVGKHVILVCDSVCCWLKEGHLIGAFIADRLKIEPGQTTEDGLFTLLPTVCLGDCDHAPTMMIDHHHYQDLSCEMVDKLLQLYRDEEIPEGDM
ncbi:NADH-quinone oxidoreductase subunit NuoE [Marinobacterium jannaschii]|uniref:NADH-quinone oxidoreductase subunit NuoE n=1 Tax=Marinobacterium jannaschii TaxID=64970 RepID=UPI00048513D4|nr:NADH-quinone oxidoreductase subunit NuoE [Marinobacterium jannaschii]